MGADFQGAMNGDRHGGYLPLRSVDGVEVPGKDVAGLRRLACQVPARWSAAFYLSHFRQGRDVNLSVGRVPSRAPGIELLGVRFDNLTEGEVVQRIMAGVTAEVGGTVVTPNVDILRTLIRRVDLRELVRSATLVLADGMPLLWAARLRGQPLVARVAGSSLIYSVSAAAAREGASIFLLGGAPGIAARAGESLQARFRGLQVAGSSCPPLGFDRDPAALATLQADLEATRPDIVFCGLGFPKQELLAGSLRDALPGAWFIGCGGALAFAAGQVPRAPQWMQRSGLEWLHRLLLEPRRLFRRYIVHDLPFAILLLARSAVPPRRQRGG